MCLHHSRVAIDVDDESGQVVALTMHQTVGVVVIAHHADALAYILGDGEFLLVEMLVNLLMVEGQHPHHDAANLEVASGDILVLAGEHHHFLTLLRFLAHVVNGARENPRVETSQRLLFASFQENAFH